MHYLLCFFAPESHVEAIKQAVFSVGAGCIDHYQYCAWQTLGEGQFMPMPGSHAFVGHISALEKVPEYKVEIVCTKKQIKDAVAAMKKAHPYEVPAYQVLQFETF